MDMNKLTEKSQEAVSDAQTSAVTYGHNEVDEEHLLLALLQQSEGLIPRLLQKMDVSVAALIKAVEEELDRKPRVSGGGIEQGKIYISQAMAKLLAAAEKEAARLKDEYVSVEHLFMSLLSQSHTSPVAKALKENGVTQEGFLKALTEVRGSQRVQSANPEHTYEALERYGRDLVVMARDGKLDPVIGRDAEIRRVIRILRRKTKNNPVLIGEPG
ncbi:type VI secretion system ATPase TssH, partial [Candidatus Sumerlaeota bacterium]|nr:type VI secretion system ATPase TssH [Candidatus Sumerlaeota bacterium]